MQELLAVEVDEKTTPPTVSRSLNGSVDLCMHTRAGNISFQRTESKLVPKYVHPERPGKMLGN